MVSDNVDPVYVAKEGAEAVPDRDLDLGAKPKVVVSRQARNELPPTLPRSRSFVALFPVVKEYVGEALVLLHPELLAVFVVPGLDPGLLVFVTRVPPFRVNELALAGLPFAAAVEEIAEEEDAVRVQVALEGFVAMAEVVVGDGDGQRINRPGAARVRVRIDELGVGDEDEVVRLRSLGL